MTLAAAVALIFCPACGELLAPHGMIIGREPELLTATCPTCHRLVEIRRDPASGKLVSAVARKN